MMRSLRIYSQPLSYITYTSINYINHVVHYIPAAAAAGAAAAKSLQLCPTLCDPINSSPPGSPIPGILQARILVCTYN